ncbi:MAG: hypothetical protein QOK29_3730 [Rhodospirillaceae bacterium]|nr:hypothetical protein [Rhodospirillaceae bacterium]
MWSHTAPTPTEMPRDEGAVFLGNETIAAHKPWAAHDKFRSSRGVQMFSTHLSPEFGDRPWRRQTRSAWLAREPVCPSSVNVFFLMATVRYPSRPGGGTAQSRDDAHPARRLFWRPQCAYRPATEAANLHCRRRAAARPAGGSHPADRLEHGAHTLDSRAGRITEPMSERAMLGHYKKAKLDLTRPCCRAIRSIIGLPPPAPAGRRHF